MSKMLVNYNDILLEIEHSYYWYKYEGEFKEGLFSGFGFLYFNEEGDDRVVGNFSEGKINGSASIYVDNKIFATGEWENN
mmetsp:Transcript_14856/g.2148  ORF Transcript_14856/g.2148 Transcript_14856/m.2148 type:complete len:80 (-) Transcript_14856:18-257(-)